MTKPGKRTETAVLEPPEAWELEDPDEVAALVCLSRNHLERFMDRLRQALQPVVLRMAYPHRSMDPGANLNRS